jgi:hypothetical protein
LAESSRHAAALSFNSKPDLLTELE